MSEDVEELFCYTKDEIESILTNTNVIDIEELVSHLSDWVKLTCFNRKEVSHLHDDWKTYWGGKGYMKEKDYIPLTHTEFNEKYSKVLNIQLVDHPTAWIAVPAEWINKWEKDNVS